MITFFIALMITIFVHEIGHMISALLCGVKVEVFSLGFGRVFAHKKFKGIDFRITPLLLGGYTKLAGEYDKRPDGFLAQSYLKKVIITVSGVLMNIVLALICYWINYKSILVGIEVDWKILSIIFTRDYTILSTIIAEFNPNFFLLQLSLLSFFCGLFNLLPFPGLDGSLLWLFLLEKKIKNFGKFLKKICRIGFVVLMLLQLLIVYYLLVFRGR